MTPPHLRIPLLVTAVALGLALVETTAWVARRGLEGRPIGWFEAVKPNLVLWLAFAVSAVIPWWMARRVPINARNWNVRLPLHAAAALVFVGVHLALNLAGQRFLGHVQGDEPFLRSLLWLFYYYVAIEMVVYASIAGVVMTLQARQEAAARMLAAETMRAELGETRLAALRSQLVPHFLFNTLNAISTLVLRGDRDAATRAIDRFSELLRYVLDDRGAGNASLASEVGFAERYLELQRMRYGERLQVSFDVPEATLEARVPRLVLQPLLENSVRHGVARRGGGTVGVRARRDGADLVIEVLNREIGGGSGPCEAGAAHGGGGGIGLANTRARLAALHGDRASLESGAENGGWAVRMRLPWCSAGVPATGDREIGAGTKR